MKGIGYSVKHFSSEFRLSDGQ